MKTSIFKCFIFIFNIFLDYFHVLKIVFVTILLILLLLLLLLLQLSFCYYIVKTPPSTPLPNPHHLDKEQQGLDVFKINGNWGSKNIARKGVLFSLEMRGCHIISRFFWRFFTMLHREKSWCVYLSFFYQTCATKVSA